MFSLIFHVGNSLTLETLKSNSYRFAKTKNSLGTVFNSFVSWHNGEQWNSISTCQETIQKHPAQKTSDLFADKRDRILSLFDTFVPINPKVLTCFSANKFLYNVHLFSTAPFLLMKFCCIREIYFKLDLCLTVHHQCR